MLIKGFFMATISCQMIILCINSQSCDKVDINMNIEDKKEANHYLFYFIFCMTISSFFYQNFRNTISYII